MLVVSERIVNKREKRDLVRLYGCLYMNLDVTAPDKTFSNRTNLTVMFMSGNRTLVIICRVQWIDSDCSLLLLQIKTSGFQHFWFGTTQTRWTLMDPRGSHPHQTLAARHTPTLVQLHRLRIKFCIDDKILRLTYKSLSVLASPVPNRSPPTLYPTLCAAVLRLWHPF